jgi:L-alanine-DL-glutamate epimerase-like enolase superfamily enzyme
MIQIDDISQKGLEMSASARIVEYRLTPLTFDRDRTIGDSQVRATTTQLVAVELIDSDGNVGLGFAQSLFSTLPDAAEIDRIFAAEVWPGLEGRHPVGLALGVRRVRGGNARRISFPFEESLQHAIWDLHAKQTGLPLWQMLGAGRSSVPVYASGLDYHLSDHDFTELFGKARERGFRGYKIKVGHPDIERDLHRLDLLRNATDSDQPIMIDANEAWTAQETIQALRSFERAGHTIYWVEDPIPRDDIDGLKMLRHLGLTRINAGEYLDLTGKRKLLEARACDMLNVHGQVSDVMRAGWLADEANVEVTFGNTFLEVGVNMALALPGVRWLEYSFQNFDHLVDEPFAMADGLIHGRDVPGHGLTLSAEARANGGALPQPMGVTA